MPAVKAVVFDLDDTLYPERAFAFSGFAAVAQAFRDVMGGPEVTVPRMCRLFDTSARRKVFDTLLEELGLAHDPELIRKMVIVYREHTPAINLYADARDCLSRLHGRFRLGLISDGPARVQRNKIAALEIAEYFDEIILTAELGEDFAKPHARAFEIVGERFRVLPNQCAYVADNPAKDFVAPNALGWRTIRIVRADGVYRAALASPGGAPQQVIASLHDLDPLLT
jgi:putative hydrolase of the HAD superfamily